ncbi:MAG: DUF4824 family protein [Verrucomicrobia bacterium]|nr:DUF4824 family protein [Verrucomicrobiota bacterium]
MRRFLIIIAAAVVLAANLWAVLQSSRNRAVALGGRLELSEEELRFEPQPFDSTVIVLNLRWRLRQEGADDPAAPPWLDAAKLTELGFDCRLPLDRPGAKEHYRSTAPRPAYLVVKRAADVTTNATGEPTKLKGLVVVDAGPEPARLRTRHPDTDRSAIVHGVVSLAYVEWNHREHKKLPTPKLAGRIDTLLPSDIGVPLPYSRLLFQHDASKRKDAPAQGPRFKATVCWGANYEPWIADLRLVEPTR